MRSRAISKKLKHQISFLENLSVDEFEPEKWHEKLITYAEIQPICDNSFSVFDNFNFGNLITEAFFIFRIRFIAGITTKMRILFKDRRFEIKRIINVEERDRMIKILALELG